LFIDILFNLKAKLGFIIVKGTKSREQRLTITLHYFKKIIEKTIRKN